eukprot:COSAG06_NODE_49922_length_322_cov_0.695067_1_plen_23_part_10
MFGRLKYGAMRLHGTVRISPLTV